jgi:hypothetical protein
MSIFYELREDFHYYVGRKLGLSQAEINSGLSKLVGKPTNFYFYYENLKKYSDVRTKRAFLIEIIKFKMSNFMGTQSYKNHHLVDEKAKQIELERLEYFISFIFDPDSDWGKWRKMLVEFGLNTPTEHVDLLEELKKLDLPICYSKHINHKSLKFYSPDRSLRNLALTDCFFGFILQRDGCRSVDKK